MELHYRRVFESATGGWVELHPLHGEDELLQNILACSILADHGYRVQLLPSIPENETALREKFLQDVFLHKNPDIRVNGEMIGDIKTPDESTIVKKSTINRGIYSAAQQKVSIVVLNLCEKSYTVRDIKNGVIGALQPGRNKTIQHVWIITKNRNLFTIDRRMIFDDSVYEILADI